MAETSPELPNLIALTGQVYLASEVTNTLTDGDLRLSQPDNFIHDPYIKVHVFSAGHWYLVDMWEFPKELRWYMPNWPRPWALAVVFQCLLKELKGWLEFQADMDYEIRYRRNPMPLRDPPFLAKALAEAEQLLTAHELKP